MFANCKRMEGIAAPKNLEAVRKKIAWFSSSFFGEHQKKPLFLEP